MFIYFGFVGFKSVVFQVALVSCGLNGKAVRLRRLTLQKTGEAVAVLTESHD